MVVECFCAGEVANSVGAGLVRFLEAGRDHHLAELGSKMGLVGWMEDHEVLLELGKARANLGLRPRSDAVTEEIEEAVLYDKIYGYIRSIVGEHLVSTFCWTKQVFVHITDCNSSYQHVLEIWG